MPDDDTATEPRRTTNYILGQIDGKLDGLVSVVGEIKDSLHSQDKRLDAVENRVQVNEQRIHSVQEWQLGHDELERTAADARKNTVTEVKRRRYTRVDVVIAGAVVAVVGEAVTHLGDGLAWLSAHLH